MVLSACKRTAGGLAVGVLLSAAAAALPAVGDIGQGTAVAQRGSYLAADPVTTLHPPPTATAWPSCFSSAPSPSTRRSTGPTIRGWPPRSTSWLRSIRPPAASSAAEPLLQRAIAIDKKALGPEHPDLAGRLNNLAVLYWATDRPAEAEPLFARALAILEKSLPPDHPALAAVRENYANLLVQLGHGSWTRLEPRLSAE